jgi:MFS family permease
MPFPSPAAGGRSLPFPDGGGTLAVGRGQRQPATLALLAFAMLIVSLDQYIVVVALPDIGRDLGYSAHTLQSVISAYAVASAGFLLLGGRAADLLGRRRVFVAGLVLYAGGSLAGSACAFHRPAARSAWPRTSDLGALDLSARSGADRVYDAGADRPQIWRAVSPRGVRRSSVWRRGTSPSLRSGASSGPSFPLGRARARCHHRRPSP